MPNTMFMQSLLNRRAKAGKIESEKQREYTKKERQRVVEGERERTKNQENTIQEI